MTLDKLFHLSEPLFPEPHRPRVLSTLCEAETIYYNLMAETGKRSGRRSWRSPCQDCSQGALSSIQGRKSAAIDSPALLFFKGNFKKWGN